MKKAVCFVVGAVYLLVVNVNSAGATVVTVPGTATGGFGAPNTGYTPMVAALTVAGPGTITITYNSGTIFFDPGHPGVGPQGGSFPAPNSLAIALPLDEAVGINTAAYPSQNLTHLGALIGAFVPKWVATDPAFQPVDGTRNIAALGIVPSELVFVGDLHVIDVNSAGTLYLGINDSDTSNNSGSFTVTSVSP